jgi:hypothetical protein
MKNWKTTLTGALTAAALYVWPQFTNVIAPLGTFLLGIFAKDHDSKN